MFPDQEDRNYKIEQLAKQLFVESLAPLLCELPIGNVPVRQCAEESILAAATFYGVVDKWKAGDDG